MPTSEPQTLPIEISLIFPVYNVEKYLEQCFAAVSKFSGDFVEFLAINDGSTDASLRILEDLAEKDKRIKVFTKENGGCASARAYGLEHAQGRYVGFIDPDDFVDDGFLSKMYKAVVFSNCQVVQCGYRKYYMENGVFEDVIEHENMDQYLVPYYSGSGPIYELQNKTHTAIWRRLYQRQFLWDNNINFHSEIKRFDDLPFFFEVFAKCTSFFLIPDVLYNYRLNRPGQDVAITDERLFVHFDIFKILEDFYIKQTAKNIHVLQNLLVLRMNAYLFDAALLEERLYSQYISKLFNDFRIHRQDFKLAIHTLRKYYGKLISIPVLFFIGIFLKSKLITLFAIKKYRERHGYK